MTEPIDTLVAGGHVVTVNATRDIIRHGAVAIRGNEIVAVGKQSDLEAELAKVRGNSDKAKNDFKEDKETGKPDKAPGKPDKEMGKPDNNKDKGKQGQGNN